MDSEGATTLDPKHLVSLDTYARWLIAIASAAMLIGCEIDEPKLAVYEGAPKVSLTLEDPIAFATEMFRYGTKLSGALWRMEGDMGCYMYLIPSERSKNAAKATKHEMAAFMLGLQYHSWYESTKYLCWIIEDLLKDPPLGKKC
jgi:hypothetical protein